jgi:hypothetical protein
LFISPKGANTDYRGAKGTIFEGMQFIYGENGIVTDSVNMGTYDIESPFKNVIGHLFEDVVPWFFLGNGPSEDQTNVTMSPELEAKIIAIYGEFENKQITKEVAIEKIYAIMPKRNEE